MEKVTIKEIAKKLDLSIATVSRAINPGTQHLVKSATRDKVLSLIKSERFVPSVAAKSLATGRSYNIVLFFRPEISSVFFDDYYSKMMTGAMDAAANTPYNIILSIVKEEEGGFDLEAAVRRLDCAAAILCNFLGVFKVSAKNVFNLDVPVLMINQYREEENPNAFLIDNFRSAYDATKYLIDKGHRRIGFVRGSAKVKDAQDRYLGFLKALKDHGISHTEKFDYQTDFKEPSAADAVRHYFSGRFTPPSALFFVNDTLAMIALNELRALKLRCPDDVSIMGFDGIDAGRYTDPALTTVLQPIYEMARDAVQEAMSIIETKKRQKGARYFSAKIIERGSVGPCHE